MTKLIFLLLFSLPLLVYSQENTSFYNTDYIEKMNNTLNVKLGFDNDAKSFLYEDSNNKYNIEPNINTRVVISTYYRFINIKIGFVPKFSSNVDTKLKGETNIFKIQSDIYLERWIQSFEYRKVKGYFVNKIRPLIGPAPPISGYLLLPELKTVSFSGSSTYKFNDDFSLKAILNQNEIQRKSAGSLISSLNYGYFKMYDKTQDLDLKSLDLVLNTGYIYTYVINQKWHSSLGFIPGLGLEFNKRISKIEEEYTTDRDNNFVFHLNTQLGLGYNSKSFYGGTFIKGIVAARGENSIIGFNTLRGVFQIYIGYRFKAPKFVEEGFDWIEDQNPLK